MLFGNKKVLLVQPRTDDSFWLLWRSTKDYLGAKTTLPPLPLLTLAALLPPDWSLRLVDMNIEALEDADIRWADLVFVTGMIIHRQEMAEILRRSKGLGKKVVVGGPFASASPEAGELALADTVYVGEAEMPAFQTMLAELASSAPARRVYRAAGFCDMKRSPAPRFDLLRRGAYATMAIQVSAGCLHRCDFCNIPALKGRSRYKGAVQVTAELDAIFALGYRGSIFVVDDNFVAKHPEAAAIVEAVIEWQIRHGFPFRFYTQADISLGVGQGIGLARKMKEAGFYAVFLGLESPSAEAMASASKHLNAKHDVAAICRNIREAGLLVYGGFIVGFDTDDASCFSRMERFVSDCGVYAAMVGMLTVLPGTPLETRLRQEGRLIACAAGDSFELPNSSPKQMNMRELLSGYRRLFAALYAPADYFRRAAGALDQWTPGRKRPVDASQCLAALRSVWRQGIRSSYGRHYWKFIGRYLFTEKAGMAFFVAIMFAHFQGYTLEVVLPRLDAELAKS